MRVGTNPDHEIEFEIEPISANTFSIPKSTKRHEMAHTGENHGDDCFIRLMKEEDLIHGNATKSSNEI